MPNPEVSAPVAQAKPKAEQPFFYGGQAVIEGVMMRGKRHYAVAVRLPTTKEIVVDRGELKAPIYTHPLWKMPFVRGLALIGEQLHLGMKSLIWSANVNAGSQNIEIGKKEITGSVAMAGVFALVIFIGLPLLLASFAVHRSGSFLFVLVEGLIRVGLVLGYLAAIATTRSSASRSCPCWERRSSPRANPPTTCSRSRSRPSTAPGRVRRKAQEQPRD